MGNNKEYRVIAKCNMSTDDGRFWIKGNSYFVRESEHSLIIEWELDEICYIISVKEAVLENFEVVE